MNKEMLRKNLMVIYMILFSLIMEIIGILVVDDIKAFTIGIIFGLVFSILKLMLMKNSIQKSLSMPEAKAQRYASVQYMVRYLLSGIALVVAALLSTYTLLGTGLSFLSMKFAAYMQLFAAHA